MIPTCIQLAQGSIAVIGFALFFLPPGYLLASLTNFNCFRDHSPAEKLLWSLCLSMPITIELCILLGRVLPSAAVSGFMLLIAGASAVQIVRSKKAGIRTTVQEGRATKIVFILTALLPVYYLLAVTDIQHGHHLYISTQFLDWSVRVPMLAAAMRSGVPPVNALYALQGIAGPLRYFYFWNVLCADLARLLHVPARAALAASSVWSAWSLLAVFFLCLKYVLGIQRHLRTHCAIAFLALGTIGLDILPTILLYVARKLHPYPEMEWWRHDRSPSILTTPLYSPHHTAAFACLLTGILVVALTMRPRGEASGQTETRAPLLFAALFAGVCFAASAGTSVFPTFTIAICCLVWVADLLRQRQFPTVSVLAASAILALLLDGTFLHELTTTPAAATGGGFATFAWRNYSFMDLYLTKYAPLAGTSVLRRAIMLQVGILVLHVFEFGFFGFVLLHRLSRDLHRTLTPSERACWALLIGAAIPFLFLSSASIASPNDLGFDAGILLRLILQLWAVPWLFYLWEDLRTHRLFTTRTPLARSALMLASIFLVLGLSGQLFQIVSQRLYIPLLGGQIIHKQMDILVTDRLSERLYNIRQAYVDLDATPSPPPETATVQYNPIGPMQLALTLYSSHQIAAFDRGCGAGYGGDYALCNAIMPDLIALYGNTLDGFNRAKAGNDRQDHAAPRVAVAADAKAICSQLHLSTLIAESTDSIWSQPTSWVWTLKPIVENSTVRVFPCPH